MKSSPSLPSLASKKALVLGFACLLAACGPKEPPPAPTTPPPATQSTEPESAPTTPTVAAPPEPIVETKPEPPPKPRASGPYTRVVALVVGNNTYQPPLKNLAGAEADAEAMARVFEEKFGFEVVRLIGPEATASRVRSEFSSLGASLDSKTDFIFYFSGHGVTYSDGPTRRNGFLVPFTPNALPEPASFDLLSVDAIDARSLVAQAARWKARHRLFILDACFSGFAAQLGDKIETRDFSPALVDKPSLHILTAGTDEELAFETPAKRGLFTSLLEAELGDTDRMQVILTTYQGVRDRVITSDKFLAERGRGTPVGRPQYRALPDLEGDFVFMNLEAQETWAGIVDAYSKSLTSGTGVGARGATLPPPATQAELRAVLEKVERKEPTGLGESELARLHARADLGDAYARAILTEHYGQGTSPEDQRLARINAREGNDTGAPAGRFALGRAYEKGYGVEKNEALGKSLQNESGLSSLIDAIKEVAAGYAELQAAKKGDAVAAVSLVGRTGKFLANINPFSALRPLSRNFRDFEAALAQDNLPKVATELNDLSAALDKLKPKVKNEAQRTALLAARAELEKLLKPAEGVVLDRAFYLAELQNLDAALADLAAAFK